MFICVTVLIFFAVENLFCIAVLVCPDYVFQRIEFNNYLVSSFTNYNGVSVKECGEKCVEKAGCVSFSYKLDIEACYVFESWIWSGMAGASDEGLVTYWRLTEECPSDYIYNSTYNVCFKAYIDDTDRMIWDDAMGRCKNDGGYLYLGNSLEKLKVMKDLYGEATVVDTRVFVGATDVVEENNWKWLDGSAIEYWASGEPNNKKEEDCATLDFLKDPNTMISDFKCGEKQLSICEIPVRNYL
ncbi:hypothetical protein SNE40_022947 [Patella caerulea]|uniref:C-type lectin n=1 Tax=Patella caerulea TaxID=87958 RepID=A0AAN8J419_PATCE